MLTGDYATDKAELLRLIAHEHKIEVAAEKAVSIAYRSGRRYQRMLRELEAAEASR